MITAILEILLDALILKGLVMLFWPHAYIANFATAVLLAIVVRALFRFLLPVLRILSFPITFLTLGLFRIVLNGAMFAIADWLLAPGVYVESFGYMMLLATLYSLVQWLLPKIVR